MNLPITYMKHESGSGVLVVRSTRAAILSAVPRAEFVANSRELDTMRRRGWLGGERQINFRNELTPCA